MDEAHDIMAECYGTLGRLESERDHLKACQENAQLHITGLVAERNAALWQRDNIAQILRDLVPGCKWRIMRPRIDAALAEIDNADE